MKINRHICLLLLDPATMQGVYTMTEIDRLNASKDLTELPQLIGFVDNLCNLLHVFKTNCCQQ